MILCRERGTQRESIKATGAGVLLFAIDVLHPPFCGSIRPLLPQKTHIQVA
jgi:hypothetical protein